MIAVRVILEMFFSAIPAALSRRSTGGILERSGQVISSSSSSGMGAGGSVDDEDDE